MRPVAEAEARERVRLHRLARPRHSAHGGDRELRRAKRRHPDQAGLASWVANIRAAEDEMATRIADMLMHGRRLARAILQRALLSEAFDCEARRCGGLVVRPPQGPRWWPPRRPGDCWRARPMAPVGARCLGGGVEAEPVVAASVARAGGVCEEALTAAFEGGGREAQSVVRPPR